MRECLDSFYVIENNTKKDIKSIASLNDQLIDKSREINEIYL